MQPRGVPIRRTTILTAGALILALTMLAAPVEAACSASHEGTVLLPSEPAGAENGPCSPGLGCRKAPGNPTGGGPCLPAAECLRLPEVMGTHVPIDASWEGLTYGLSSGVTQPCVGCQPANPLGTHPNLAISWFDEDDALVRVDDNKGDEWGVVPDDATDAIVTYRGALLEAHFWLDIGCEGA